jgi:hypothetical protein
MRPRALVLQLLEYTFFFQRCLYIRAVLKGHRDRISIDTAHEQTEQTANREELLESCRVDSRNLQETKDNHVDDHRPVDCRQYVLDVFGMWYLPLATELISAQTERRCTN